MENINDFIVLVVIRQRVLVDLFYEKSFGLGDKLLVLGRKGCQSNLQIGKEWGK